MDEQTRSSQPGSGRPLRAPRTREEIEQGAAEFRRLVAEGNERHRLAMLEENPDPRQSRISLLVGLSPNPAPVPATAPTTAESLSLFGEDQGRDPVTAESTPRPLPRDDEREATIFARILACRRLTGDDSYDLDEIYRVVDEIDDYREATGDPDALAEGRTSLMNTIGLIIMRRMHHHDPPYTQAEHRAKVARMEDIAAGRVRPEIVLRHEREGWR